MKCRSCEYTNRAWALVCSMCGEVLGREEEETPWERLPRGVRREITTRRRHELATDLAREQAVRREMARIGGLTALFLVLIAAFGDGSPRPLALWLGLALQAVAGAVAGCLLARHEGGIVRGFLYSVAAWLPVLSIRYALGWADRASMVLEMVLSVFFVLPGGGLLGFRVQQFYENLRPAPEETRSVTAK